MSELTLAGKWLYGLLSADATLTGLVAARVHDTRAEGVYPCIVFQYQGGYDALGVGARRLQVNALYVVWAVGKTVSPLALAPIADRIDELLHRKDAPVVIGGVTLGYIGCYRVQPFAMAETSNNIEYRHLGGIYRLMARED